MFFPIKLAIRIFSAFAMLIVGYFVVTGFQVWMTSTKYDPQPAQAIIVMGAAQYNGTPSPDLQSRLDEALTLFNGHYASLIVTTGSKQPGDQFTEAQAGFAYLVAHGVPATDILQVGGSDSWENLVDADDILKTRHLHNVLIVTDPFHEDRSLAISSGLGLNPHPTPTQNSPIKGWSVLPYFAKETVGVGLGRIIGYSHLEWLHDT